MITKCLVCTTVLMAALGCSKTPSPPVSLHINPQHEIEWEHKTLGIDRVNMSENEYVCYFVSSRTYGVTSLRKSGEKLFVGTADGVVVCDNTGKRLGFIHNTDSQVGVRHTIALDHVVVGIVSLSDGTLWAKTVSGGLHFTGEGNLLEAYDSDRLAIEGEYNLILKERSLQEWFPVRGTHVYHPWCKNDVAYYDGKGWNTIAVAGNKSLRVFNIAGRMAYAGEDGPRYVDTGLRILDTACEYYTVQKLDDNAWIFGGSNMYLWTNGNVKNIGAGNISDTGLNCHGCVWSKFYLRGNAMSPTVEIYAMEEGMKKTGSLTLPYGHMLTGYAGVPSGVGSSLYLTACRASESTSITILTTKGLVESDMLSTKEILAVPLPTKMPDDVIALTRYGVNVTSCIFDNDRIVIGTLVGLGEYIPKHKTFRWLWKVEK